MSAVSLLQCSGLMQVTFFCLHLFVKWEMRNMGCSILRRNNMRKWVKHWQFRNHSHLWEEGPVISSILWQERCQAPQIVQHNTYSHSQCVFMICRVSRHPVQAVVPGPAVRQQYCSTLHLQYCSTAPVLQGAALARPGLQLVRAAVAGCRTRPSI